MSLKIFAYLYGSRQQLTQWLSNVQPNLSSDITSIIVTLQPLGVDQTFMPYMKAMYEGTVA